MVVVGALDVVQSMWGDWLWFAGIAFSIVTCLLVSVYMIGSMLMNDKMKAWAKMEFAELIYSAIIIIIAIPGIQLADAVVTGALTLVPQNNINAPNLNVAAQPTPGGGACPGATSVTWTYIQHVNVGNIPILSNGFKDYQCENICGDDIAVNDLSVYHNITSCSMRLGIWYLREINDETSTFAFQTYLDYIQSSMIAEFTINFETIFEKTGFITFNPWKGFVSMGNNVKSLTFEWAMKILMITKFQEIFLRFIATALFPALFILGALLRTFTFTRRLGGLLLAMAIALYFIYPSFYAFGAVVILKLKDDVRQGWLNDKVANPPDNSGNQNMDPPIANSMVTLGDIPVIGGRGIDQNGQPTVNALNIQNAKNQLLDLQGYGRAVKEGEDPATIQYLQNMQISDPTVVPKLGNLAPDQSSALNAPPPDPATDAEHAAAMVQASKAFNVNDQTSWFGRVSRLSKTDPWMYWSWSPNGPLDILSRLTFWSMFFSLLSIISTIAAMRSLSITFGGDIEIAGLTRLI